VPAPVGTVRIDVRRVKPAGTPRVRPGRALFPHGLVLLSITYGLMHGLTVYGRSVFDGVRQV